MAFWSAVRRWAERAVAAGVLSLDQIREGDAEAYALLPAACSPKQTRPAGQQANDEAEELLDGLLLALVDLPGESWPDLAAALPDEIFDRIDR